MELLSQLRKIALLNGSSSYKCHTKILATKYTKGWENISRNVYIYIYKFWIHLLSAHRFPFSSIDDSEAESSNVEFEMVSLSEVPDGLSWSTGCFKYQYIMLAVNVRIIFWFTWKRKGANLIYVLFWNKIGVPRANEVSSCNSSSVLIRRKLPQLGLREAKIWNILASLQYWWCKWHSSFSRHLHRSQIFVETKYKEYYLNIITP